MFSLYKNQSTGIQNKSIDWFLEDGNSQRERVKESE